MLCLKERNNHGLVNDEQDDFQDDEDESNRLVSPLPSIRADSISFPIEHPLRSEHWKMINTIQKDNVMSDAADRARKCSVCKDVGHNSQTCQRKVISSLSRADVPFFTINGASIFDMQDLNALPDLHATGGDIIRW